MDDVSGLPYSEIADALGSTPHSRHMMGALLSLCPHIDGDDGLARACMSPEFARSAGGCQQNKVVQELIAHGRLSGTRVQEYAEKAFRNIGAANENERTALLALGSPLLESALPAFQRKNSECQNEIVNDAFWGNPLVHLSDKSSTSVLLGRYYFARNAALFGNLKNTRVRSAITAHVGMEDKEMGFDGLYGGCGSALRRRTDLDDEIVLALDKASMSTSAYRRLVKHPCHRRAVQNALCAGFKSFADAAELPFSSDGMIIASPEVMPSEFRRIYNSTEPESSSRDSLLLAASCSEECYLDAVAHDRIILDSFAFATRSPLAIKHFANLHIGDLLRRHENENALMWVSLPAIPFGKVEPQDVPLIFVAECDVELGCVVGAIRSRSFAEKLPASSAKFAGFAQLFSPHTSGLRLGEFARGNPGLAGLSACHPNGADIPLSAVLPEHRDVVEAVRPPVLCGRGYAGCDDARPALVI